MSTETSVLAVKRERKGAEPVDWKEQESATQVGFRYSHNQ